MGRFASVAAGLGVCLCAAANDISSKLTQRSFVGSVFGIALNGTTNQQQFFSADLDTFVVSPIGAALGDQVDVIGSASVIDPISQIFWTTLYYFGAELRSSSSAQRRSERTYPMLATDEIALVGINITTGAVVQSFQTSNWTGAWLFVDGIYLLDSSSKSASGVSRLFLVASDPKAGMQYFITLDPATGDFNVSSGATPVDGCGDSAWDVTTGYLYQVCTDGSDDDSGNMTITSTFSQPPAIAGSFPLSNFFDLPQWDPQTSSLTGLMLASNPQSGAYGRNFTVLYPQADTFNISVRGGLGSFFALYDGPKAIDVVGRRAFYVIATSAMGEMDLVTVDIDSDPTVILESPGICGFIGYCPGVIAYYAGSGGR